MKIDKNNIYVKSIKRYHKYLDEHYGIRYIETSSDDHNRYQLEHAEKLMKQWFEIYDEWFGIKIKINSIEEFNMIADLMGY